MPPIFAKPNGPSARWVEPTGRANARPMIKLRDTHQLQFARMMGFAKCSIHPGQRSKHLFMVSFSKGCDQGGHAAPDPRHACGTRFQLRKIGKLSIRILRAERAGSSA
jgi:hypothetical protein